MATDTRSDRQTLHITERQSVIHGRRPSLRMLRAWWTVPGTRQHVTGLDNIPVQYCRPPTGDCGQYALPLSEPIAELLGPQGPHNATRHLASLYWRNTHSATGTTEQGSRCHVLQCINTRSAQCAPRP